jgi:hypothetical protein
MTMCLIASSAHGEPDAEELDWNKVADVLKLDVISYFSAEEEVATPLKKKNYLASDEYKQRLAELTAEKKKLVGARRFLKLTAALPEYDLKAHAFLIPWPRKMEEDPAGTLEGVNLPRIPLQRRQEEDSLCGTTEVEIFVLKVPEKEAAPLEGARVEIDLIFEIEGNVKEMTARYREYNGVECPWKTSTRPVLTTRKTTMQILGPDGATLLKKDY